MRNLLDRFPFIFLVIVGASCVKTPSHVASEELCLTNMVNVWWGLKTWVGDGDTFPSNLNELDKSGMKLNTFVCPATLHKPSSSKSVDSWTDYIYLAGLLDAPPSEIPILVCPPENHKDSYGNVLWKD